MRLFMTNKHTRWQREFSAYMDGRLAPRDRQALERHLEGCAACQANLESLQRLVALVRRLPQVPVPRSFALAHAPARAPRWDSRYAAPLRYSTAAAALLLLVVVTSDVLTRPSTVSAPRAPATAGPELARSAAEPAGSAAFAVPTPDESALSTAVSVPPPQFMDAATAAKEADAPMAVAQPTAAQEERPRGALWGWVEIALGVLLAVLAAATSVHWLVRRRLRTGF